MKVTVYGIDGSVRRHEQVSHLQMLRPDEKGTLTVTKPDVPARLLVVNPASVAEMIVEQECECGK